MNFDFKNLRDRTVRREVTVALSWPRSRGPVYRVGCAWTGSCLEDSQSQVVDFAPAQRVYLSIADRETCLEQTAYIRQRMAHFTLA